MTPQTITWLHVAVVVLLSWQSHAWIYGGDFSKSFEECFTIREKGANNVAFTKGVYEQYCTDLLLPLDKTHQRIGNFSSEQMSYIQQLFRQMYTEAYKTQTNRMKRYAKASYYVQPGSGTRTEVRSFNGTNFRQYAEAVQRLKKTGEYDTIAAIHGTVVKTAHFGVNLLPWHRLYLMIFETACGVPVPYWDSTIDAHMKDPTKSVVWTPKFFGNGIGKVTVGPFAYFKTPAGPLFRKIGATGMLMEREVIYNIWSKRHLSQISTPTAKHNSNAEGQHNNVHAWVNGVMGNIAISSFDPVFFCHHSLLDYVWEIFRFQQQAIGINPENDLVKTKAKGQRPGDRSGIKGFYNRDGYSHRTSKSTIYRAWGQCSYCDDNKYVYCDYKRGVCVSKGVNKKPITIGQLKAADHLAAVSGLSSGKFGGPFRPFMIDPRTRGDPVQLTKLVLK